MPQTFSFEDAIAPTTNSFSFEEALGTTEEVPEKPSVLRQIGQGATPAGLMHSAARLGTGLYNLIGSGFVNILPSIYKKAMGQPTETPVFGTYDPATGKERMESTLPFKPLSVGQDLLPGLSLPRTDPELGPVDPVSQALNRIKGSVLTPELAVGGPVLGMEGLIPNVLKAVLAGGMTQQLPQTAAPIFDPDATWQEQLGAGIETAAVGGSALALGRGPIREALTPTPKGLTGKPIDLVKSEGPSGLRPVDFRDIEAINAQERGYGITEGKRPSQQMPQVLGEQRQRQVFYEAPQQEIIRPTVIGRPPVEPSGGEISFRGQAGGIPNARQQAIEAKWKEVEREPEVVSQVLRILDTKDRLELEQLRNSIVGPEEKPLSKAQMKVWGPLRDYPETGIEVQQPSLSVARNTSADLLRLVTARLQEITRDTVDPELQYLRQIVAKEPEALPVKQPPISTEVKVSPVNQKKLYAGEAMIFDPEFYRQTARGVADMAKFSKEMIEKYGPDVADAVRKGIVLAQQDRQKPWNLTDTEVKHRKAVVNQQGQKLGHVAQNPRGEWRITGDIKGLRLFKTPEEAAQVLVKEDFPSLVQQEILTKPEIAKLAPAGSGRPNKLGDPLGTTYHATPADFARYNEIQSEFKRLAAEGKGFDDAGMVELFRENETIKNKYGGMPPQAPKSVEPPQSTKLYSAPGMLFDPKFYKETAKGVKDLSSNLGEYFKGAESKVIPALNLDTKSPLPDFQPKDIANKVFSQPFASEKIPVLGRLMGGKARIRTPQDEAVATWYAERHGVGPAVASHVGEQIRGKLKNEFSVNDKGDLNVGRKMAGQSLKTSDVFEALVKDPLSYTLTLKQRKAFNEVIRPITDRMTQLADKYDLLDEVVDESGTLRPYFPRIVVEHPKTEGVSGPGPTLFNPLKSRAFPSEAEGWSKGYKYELDMEKRLVTGVERLYRAIANKRLADDPVLGAKSMAQVKATMREAYAEELASGEMTLKRVDRIAEGVAAKGRVMQPALYGKIFDQATAKMLNKEFGAEQSRIRQNLANVNSLLKAITLGFDVGVGQIQMLPTLYNNPRIWAESQFRSLQSMASPKFFAEYVRQNKDAVSELSQLGSSVGRLQEMMTGLGKGELLSKVPVVGKVGQAFGRQFQTALDVAKVEFWKALRETAPKSEWPALVRSIETTLLSGRMESAMVPHGRALLERFALLAPSYYRGAVDSIAGLAERGASGKTVRNAMGRFIVGGLITYYVGAKMAGMDDAEIKKRLNPANVDYLQWQVKQEDGSIVNIGFGGIHRSLLRLAGNIVKTSVEHPENWKSLAPENNPMTRWYRSHAGPSVSLTWEGFSGKDFLGRESDMGSLGVRALPLAAQQAFTKEGEAPAKPIEYVASVVGMSATPENFSKRRAREVEDLSKSRFNKSFAELTLGQRRNVEAEVEKKLAAVPRGMTSQKARDIATRGSDERLKSVNDALSSEAKDWMKKHSLKLRNYETSLTIGGTTVHLTETEREKLHSEIVKEYQEAFNTLKSNARISAMDTPTIQRYVDVHLERARKIAWARVRRDIGKKPLQLQEP